MQKIMKNIDSLFHTLERLKHYPKSRELAKEIQRLGKSIEITQIVLRERQKRIRN